MKTVFCLLLFISSSWAGNLTGTIKGDVHLLDDVPKGSTPAVVEYHGPCGTKRSTSVIKLWKSRILDVTLWLIPLEDEDGERKTAKEESVIMEEGCDFLPRMTVIEPGSTVRVVNKDETVQWLIIENGRKQQIMQEPDSDPVELKIGKDNNIHLSSGFYKWMEAWIRPVENVVATTETDWDGRFYFKGIIPGRYILHAWHPSLGDIAQEVVVEADETKQITVGYHMPEDNPLPVIESTMLNELLGVGKNKEDEDPFSTGE